MAVRTSDVLATLCAVYNALNLLCWLSFAAGWFFAWLNRTLALHKLKRNAEARTGTLASTSAPQVTFVMPCKGTHPGSSASWISQVCGHGYHGKVECLFVVQEATDPAYLLLKEMQEDGRLPMEGLRVLVAGLASKTSQKLHNMIYAIERACEAAPPGPAATRLRAPRSARCALGRAQPRSPSSS